MGQSYEDSIIAIILGDKEWPEKVKIEDITENMCLSYCFRQSRKELLAIGDPIGTMSRDPEKKRMVNPIIAKACKP